jgi:hypothetical protein
MKKLVFSGTLGVLSEILYTLAVLGLGATLTALIWLIGV